MTEQLDPDPNCPKCHGTGECSNAQFRCECRWRQLPDACPICGARWSCEHQGEHESQTRPVPTDAHAALRARLREKAEQYRRDAELDIEDFREIVAVMDEAGAAWDAQTARADRLERERDEIRDAVIHVDNVYRREKQAAEAQIEALTAERTIVEGKPGHRIVLDSFSPFAWHYEPVEPETP